MSFHMKFHYDNSLGFQDPYLWIWYTGSGSEEKAPMAQDAFGFVYDVDVRRQEFGFKFKDGPGTLGPWEPGWLDRDCRPWKRSDGPGVLDEIWCRGDKAFVYPMAPKTPEPVSAEAFLRQLPFKPGQYIPEAGGLSGVGAHLLEDGRVVFGLYHPNAARVYVMGTFNDWQRPGDDQPDETQFLEMNLYRGYFGIPNTWLVVTDRAHAGDEYKFCVIGGVPSDEKHRLQQYFTDPYARRLGPDYGYNNSVVVDPTGFTWTDANWATPDVSQLILYELSVYGLTEGDGDIQAANQGKFAGITERVRMGYFGQLGVTALALMPLAEVPSMQAPDSLGYDPSLFCTVERDFGSPDDLRELVNAAHEQGLAVILDEVFNHTSNKFNPLWQMILEHPRQEGQSVGGLYFEGGTRWGNRIATGKTDVQNMLIDACRLLLAEYHVDGFRLDATHHDDWMDFGFLDRLARELKAVKPDVILIAENLPNQSDLNRQGFDGYAQWCDGFHDKLKALLREGNFGDTPTSAEDMGDIFYFSKGRYASHTNNVVNYCESHDETSVSYEVGTNPSLKNGPAQDRKGRLGLFASMVALGQPMLYMGQEFNVWRDSKTVRFDWPESLDQHGFYQWARRLIHLRRRYPGLRLSGYDPASVGQFTWIIAPWMGPSQGGGQRAIGWRSRPNQLAHDTLVVLMNFEGRDVVVDLDLGIPGVWVKLADIERVNDLPPEGVNSAEDAAAIRTPDGQFAGFTLPSSSAFIYKWEAPP